MLEVPGSIPGFSYTFGEIDQLDRSQVAVQTKSLKVKGEILRLKPESSYL